MQRYWAVHYACAKESGEATSVVEVSLNCTFLLEQGEGVVVKGLLLTLAGCHMPAWPWVSTAPSDAVGVFRRREGETAAMVA